VARLAVPDSDRVSLDGCLSAEGADVFGVLGDLHLLHLLTKGGTVSVIRGERVSIPFLFPAFFLLLISPPIAPVVSSLNNLSTLIPSRIAETASLEWIVHIPCTVLAGNSDLLGSLRHLGWCCGDEGFVEM
jgi:hypothetical protein